MRLTTLVLFSYVYVMLFSSLLCNWWSASIQLIHAPEKLCEKRRRVRGIQAETCQNEPEIIHEIVDGINMGKEECQAQFKDRKWNCTSKKRSLKKILKKDTKESGFVNAIAAAGVMYKITRGCSSGNILLCTCDRNVQNAGRSDFQWAGCSDNIDFGYKTSSAFMDSRWRRRRHDIKTKILLHNYEAGRAAVRDSMRQDCRCHGLTGSCTMKTCWMKMSSFQEIGAELRDRFDSSVHVMTGNDGKTFVPVKASIEYPAKEDIVYLQDSPNFCKVNRRVGVLGTRGRLCELDSVKTNGCSRMCCDRDYITRTRIVQKNCRCRFKWCCDVHCDTCEYRETYSECL